MLFSLGCARTVTQIETYGDQMTVEVTLRGTVETDANCYFLVLSSDSNYSLPLPPPNEDEDAPEFIEPGMTPLVGSPEAYYAKFFSTWSGYIVLDIGQYFLVGGPFILNQTPTRAALSNLGEISSKLSFSFRLERIFGTIPENVYFDFVAVPWPSGDAKIPADHLPSTNNYIATVLGSIKKVDDEVDISLNPSLDIVSCQVEIQ